MFVKNNTFYQQVYDILVYLGGAPEGMRDTFIYAHCHDKYPTKEWRFQGKLGFGGKYRSETNKVDCYSEDETTKRIELIKQMNETLTNLTIPQPLPILYVDMDGVVADFDHEIKKVHPNVFELEDGDERSRIIDETVEADVRLFLRLKPIDGALEAIEKLKGHYNIYFLSTPMWNVPESLTDKRLWLENTFGDFAKKRLILTHRKDLNIGAYLIDDRLKNGAENFTGMHIHFGTEKFPNWESVLNFLIPKTIKI
jgi:5'-nucleotidase